tara:strand:+ start:83 stop:361 length:279 start_codon:yes stop_codon:yes gene_type:complete
VSELPTFICKLKLGSIFNTPGSSISIDVLEGKLNEFKILKFSEPVEVDLVKDSVISAALEPCILVIKIELILLGIDPADNNSTIASVDPTTL